MVNQDPPFEDGFTRQITRGVIVDSRIGRGGGPRIEMIERTEIIEKVAVLIKPVKKITD